MDEIMSIVAFCVWFGTMIICIILIINGIWRWLGNSDLRSSRLKSAAWIAAVILGVMLLIYRQTDLMNLFSDPETNDGLTSVVVNASKILVKLLMLGAVVACVLLLLCVVFLFVRYAVNIIKQIKTENKDNKQLIQNLQDKSQELSEIIKTPIFILVITCGILGVFTIMPLLMGESGTESLNETWHDGVKKIASYAGNESAEHPLLIYILIFIIVLGVGCAVIQILYSIIRNIFTQKKGNGIIDEYSGSMGILSVGMSILWTLQKKNVNIFAPDSNTISEFLKSFGTVLLIIAVGILVLETIRLLVDMSERLIRIEGKYLFIFLVGQSTILLLSILNSICGAVNAIIDNKENSALDQIQNKIRNAMIAAMDQQINGQKEHKRTFSGFIGKSTKK